MHELKRVFANPLRWLTLLLIAAVNLALFAGYCRSIPAQTAEEAAEYLEYIAHGYDDYLDRVSTQSEAQTILGGLRQSDDFVSRNLQKTRADYAKLQGITVREGENRGICAVTDFGITDFLVLIMPLLLVLSFAAERGAQVTELLRTAQNGRAPLTLWRIAAVFLLSCICTAVLYGSNIVFAHVLFGNPDYTRAVQSVPAFQLCAYRVSIGGYLLAAAAIRTAAVTLTALAVWLIWGMFRQVPAIAVSVGLFGTAWLCHRLILPTASLNLLKFCNLFAMLSPEVFFTRYANLNLLGHTVGFMPCMLVFGGFCLLFCCVLCTVLLGICRPVKIGAATEIMKDRIAKRISRIQPRLSLFGYEGRKLLISEGGILILLAGVLYAGSLYQSMHISAPLNPELTAIYIEYEGEVTAENIENCQFKIEGFEQAIAERREKLARLEQAERRDPTIISKLNGEIFELQHQLDLYTAFLQRMEALADYRSETGNDAWLIRQNGWNLLFTETAPARRCTTALLLVLVFLFAPLFAYENRCGALPLLRSTVHGRGRLLHTKLCWVLLLTLLSSFAFHGIYAALVIQNTVLPFPDAPAHSLDLLRKFPLTCSLYTCGVMLYLLRYLAALAVAAAVLCISRCSRHPQAALLTALAVFLLPAALAEIGMPLPDPVRFLCLSVK